MDLIRQLVGVVLASLTVTAFWILIRRISQTEDRGTREERALTYQPQTSQPLQLVRSGLKGRTHRRPTAARKKLEKEREILLKKQQQWDSLSPQEQRKYLDAETKRETIAKEKVADYLRKKQEQNALQEEKARQEEEKSKAEREKITKKKREEEAERKRRQKELETKREQEKSAKWVVKQQRLQHEKELQECAELERKRKEASQARTQAESTKPEAKKKASKKAAKDEPTQTIATIAQPVVRTSDASKYPVLERMTKLLERKEIGEVVKKETKMKKERKPKKARKVLLLTDFHSPRGGTEETECKPTPIDRVKEISEKEDFIWSLLFPTSLGEAKHAKEESPEEEARKVKEEKERRKIEKKELEVKRVQERKDKEEKERSGEEREKQEDEERRRKAKEEQERRERMKNEKEEKERIEKEAVKCEREKQIELKKEEEERKARLEEKKKRDEEQQKAEEEKTGKEGEARKQKEAEEKAREEEADRLRKEAERQIQEEAKKAEKERERQEEAKKQREEEERLKREEEEKKRKEEERLREEKDRIREDEARRLKEEEERIKKEEEDRKRQEEARQNQERKKMQEEDKQRKEVEDKEMEEKSRVLQSKKQKEEKKKQELEEADNSLKSAKEAEATSKEESEQRSNELTSSLKSVRECEEKLVKLKSQVNEGERMLKELTAAHIQSSALLSTLLEKETTALNEVEEKKEKESEIAALLKEKREQEEGRLRTLKRDLEEIFTRLDSLCQSVVSLTAVEQEKRNLFDSTVKEVEEAENKKKEEDEKVSRAKEKVESIQSEEESLRDSEAKSSEELKEKKKVADSLMEKEKGAEANLDRLKREEKEANKKLASELEKSEGKVRAAEENEKEKKAALQATEEKIEELSQQFQERVKDAEQKRAEAKNSEAEEEKARSEAKEKADKEAKMREDFERAQKSEEEAKSCFDSAIALEAEKRKALEDSERQLSSFHSSLVDQVTALKEKEEKLKTEVESLSASLSTHQNSLIAAKEEVETARELLSSATSSVGNLQQQLEKTKDEEEKAKEVKEHAEKHEEEKQKLKEEKEEEEKRLLSSFEESTANLAKLTEEYETAEKAEEEKKRKEEEERTREEEEKRQEEVIEKLRLEEEKRTRQEEEERLAKEKGEKDEKLKQLRDEEARMKEQLFSLSTTFQEKAKQLEEAKEAESEARELLKATQGEEQELKVIEEKAREEKTTKETDFEEAKLHSSEAEDNVESLLLDEAEKEEAFHLAKDECAKLEVLLAQKHREGKILTFPDGTTQTYGELETEFLACMSTESVSTLYNVDDSISDFRGSAQGVHKTTGQVVAIMDLDKESWEEDKDAYFLEWVVRNQDNFLSLQAVHHTRNSYSLVRTFSEYSLFDIVEDNNFDEDDTRDVVRQILTALTTLHGLGIAHRNIKPDSFASELREDLESGGGVSVKLSNLRSASIFDRTGRAGTLSFMAPEILEGKEYTEQIDMWSLGVLTFSLLMGYNPFDDEEDDDKTEENIKGKKIHWEGEEWVGVSELSKDFILKCLMLNPEERISSKDARNHQWLQVVPKPIQLELPEDLLADVESPKPAEFDTFASAELEPPLASPSIVPKATTTTKKSTGPWKRRVSRSQLTPEEQQKAFREWIKVGDVEEDYSMTKEKSSCFKHFVKATDKKTNAVVAVTTIPQKACKILGPRLMHRRIGKLRSIHILSNAAYRNDAKNKVHIVREWADEDLFEQMEATDDGHFDETEGKIIIRQMLRALKRLHVMDVAHRNVRLESIAARLDEEEGMVAKLTRFSLASQLDRSEELGLPAYRAPEMVNKKSYTVAIDMWALGVVSYLILAGYPPFEGDDDDETFSNINACNLAFPEEEWGEISPEAQDFIKQCCEPTVDARISVFEAFKHPWIGLEPPTPKKPELTDDDIKREIQAKYKNKWRPHCKAVCDFVAGDSTQLSFTVGEIIYVLEYLEGDWWFGQKEDGSEGYFPHSAQYAPPVKRTVNLKTTASGTVAQLKQLLAAQSPIFQ